MFRWIATLFFIGAVSCQVIPTSDNVIIQSSWKPFHIGSATDVGVKLLLAWFTAYPKVQAEFPKFKNIPLSQLKNSKDFQTHATKMYHVIDDAVMKNNWNNVEKLSAYHKNLGKTDKTKYNQFRAVLMQQLKLNTAQTVVWNKFLDIFFHHLFIHF